MTVTDLMIEKSLLRLLDTMAQAGVPIRDILIQAVTDGIVADPSNNITDCFAANTLVQWYVDSLTNFGEDDE